MFYNPENQFVYSYLGGGTVGLPAGLLLTDRRGKKKFNKEK